MASSPYVPVGRFSIVHVVPPSVVASITAESKLLVEPTTQQSEVVGQARE